MNWTVKNWFVQDFKGHGYDTDEWRDYDEDNTHLMTGPEGNSEFCFPETLNVPRGEAEGNIEVEGKQTHCFPWDQSLSVLLYLPTQGGTIHWCQLMTLLQNVTNPNNLHIK